MTFIFVNVILTIKYHYGAKDHILNALAIGTSLVGMITVAGGISGGCLNPAVGLVQTIFQSIVVKKHPLTFGNRINNELTATTDNMWVYILAPLTGGILAGLWQQYNARVID